MFGLIKSSIINKLDYAQMLRMAARSENTRIAYNKGWQCFSMWCEHIELEPEKAKVDDVVQFFVDMARNGRSASGKPLALNTLRLYRSALNDRWYGLGLPSPASDKSIDEILQGLARLQGNSPRRVKALREHQILAMLESCGKGLHGLRDAAIITLGFSAALRRSELCQLYTDDLQRKAGDRLIVRIRKSKTDARGIGQNVAVIEGKYIKPIAHLERWLQASGIREGFVFQTILRGGVASSRPLDSGEIARLIKRHVKRIGLDPQEFSGHSLRAGFVTSAAAHHARIDKIMEVTRHKSAETLLKYIRDEDSFIDHAGASFL